MTVPKKIVIQTEQDIVLARQTGRTLSRELGFDNISQMRIATTISELARNIFLYAGTGEITIEAIANDEQIGIKITAQDKGPGIPDIRRAVEDGFSTSGGLGAGLPGARRMMDEFYLDSLIGCGTKVVVIKWYN